MDKEQVTIKIWSITRKLAKILAAHCDISLVELLHRLVTEEMERRGIKQ